MITYRLAAKKVFYCLLLIIFLHSHAFAQLDPRQFSLQGTMGFSYTDNAGLDCDDKQLACDDVQEEFEQNVSLALGYVNSTRWYEAELDYQLAYLNYYNDFFAEEYNFTGSGELQWHIVPTILDWNFSFQQQEFLTDSNQPSTPDNRERRSILSTGPVYTQNITTVDQLFLGAEYTQTSSETEASGDTKRAQFNGEFSHQISSITRVKLNGAYTDIFEYDGYRGYTNTLVSVGFVRLFKNGIFDINYGRNFVRIDNEESDSLITVDRQDIDGVFSDITYRNLFFNNEIQLRALNELTDSAVGLGLADFIAAEVENVDSNISFNDIVERTRYEIQISRTGQTYSIALLYYEDEEDFQTRPQDEKEKAISLVFNKKIIQPVSIEFSVFNARTEFISQPAFGKNKDWEYSLRGFYSQSDAWSFSSYIKFSERSNEAQRNKEYEEFSFGLDVTYSFF